MDETKPKGSSPVEELLEKTFAKLKELGDADAASRWFPNGIGSLEIEVAIENSHVSVKLGSPPKAALLAPEVGEAEDDEDDASVSFNAEGHRVVAGIAMADLDARFPATAAAVRAMLQAVNRSTMEAATFPDDIKSQHPETKPFHYVDIEFKDNGPVNPPIPPAPHVLSKIAEFTAFLTAGGGTNQQKADALSWIFHLIGDVHQPLHCIEHVSNLHPGGDAGGNSFKLKGKARNLHSLWDSSVDFSNQDEEDLIPSIMTEHPRSSLGSDLGVTDVEAWARAGFLLAKRFAYNLQENPQNPPKPSATYLKNANAVGRRQAALAGYRLANHLKTILG